jgi:uncharacterized protein
MQPEAPLSTDGNASARVAAGLRGFGAVGILAILAIAAGTAVSAVIGAVLVLVWLRWSRTEWREIGYVRPRSWIGDLAIGVVAGGLLKLLQKSIVMPLLGAAAVNPTYHYLAGNAAAIPGILLMVIVGGGFAEETVYRGYLFERLGKLLGTGVGAKALIVLVSSALFALAHYPEQGLPGMQQAMMTGAVFGTIFAATGRIWLPMCMHVAYDLVAIAMIYWDLETAVAHWVFG